MLMWNYRGYGVSEGSPNPDQIKADGERVFDFLKKRLKLVKIGIHGESVGGLAATHIARNK